MNMNGKVKQATIEAVKEYVKEDWEQLREAAKKYVSVMQKEMKSYEIQESERKRITNRVGISLLDDIQAFVYVRKSILNTEKAQILAPLLHDFDTALNKFLKRIIILTYVSPDGEVFFRTSVEQREIYKNVTQETSKERFRAKLPIEMLRQKTSQDLKKIQDRFDVQKKGRVSVYRMALYRFRRKDIDYKKRNPSRQNTFYYRLASNRMRSSKVTGAGFIAGAYLEAVLNDIPGTSVSQSFRYTKGTHSYDKNKEMEDALRAFSRLKGLKIEHIPGVYKGDVTLYKVQDLFPDMKTVQLASKSMNTASIQSFTPSLRVALNILAMGDTPSNKLIQGAIPQLDAVNKKSILKANQILINEILKGLDNS